MNYTKVWFCVRSVVKESLDELARLADTAGLLVIGRTYQMLEKASPRSYIGSGKVAEIAAAVRALSIDTVIFDDELSPGQQRNLEKALGEKVRIADRTMLILDIFKQRARTREGRLQVELAAVTYQLPRLKRMWTHLERQMGSGAMRSGMGESQMEVDRRLLRCVLADTSCWHACWYAM
jgi:GTPase